MNPHWQVSFKGTFAGEWIEDALNAMAGAAIRWAIETKPVAGGGTEHWPGTTVWVRAADDQAAIAVVKAVLESYGSFDSFSARPVSYLMEVGFLDSEAAAIEAVIKEASNEDLRISQFVSLEPSKSSAEILLELPATDQDDATKQAREIYADLRRHAGLSPAKPLYGFIRPLGPFPPEHVKFAERARRLLGEGTYDYAIVAAQTSCELIIATAITELRAVRKEPAAPGFANHWFDKRGRSLTLMDTKLRRYWNALAEEEIQKEEWWKSYERHVGRRHGVLHRGWMPSKDDAEQSLAAADAFREHLENKIQQARGQNGAT